MAREDAAVFHKEFVTVKIDIDRMTGGKDVLAAYPKSDKQGIPWFVFLQPDGKELGDSMGPKGNIGCPVQPEEIAWFRTMLEKSTKRLTAEELDALQKLNQAFAKRVLTKRGG